MDTEEQFYVSWRGNVTGPFTLEQIETRLRQRSINSLSRVQIGGEWVLLRDALAQLREKDSDPGPDPVRAPDPAPTVELARAQPVDEVREQPHEAPEHPHSPESGGDVNYGQDADDSSGRGLGITSFVLSFFFAVPILNMLTMVLSIVFGHISIRGGLGADGARQRSLPWFAVWTSYVHAGFLLMVILIIAVVAEDLDVSGEILGEAILYQHWTMLGIGVAAALGGGLLMLAVKMLANYWPSFAVCYVGALAPLAVLEIVAQLILNQTDVEGREILIVYGAANGIMLLIQLLLWASLIQSPQGKPLGYGGAAVASLFYTIVSFITFISAFLLGALNT